MEKYADVDKLGNRLTPQFVDTPNVEPHISGIKFSSTEIRNADVVSGLIPLDKNDGHADGDNDFNGSMPAFADGRDMRPGR